MAVGIRNSVVLPSVMVDRFILGQQQQWQWPVAVVRNSSVGPGGSVLLGGSGQGVLQVLIYIIDFFIMALYRFIVKFSQKATIEFIQDESDCCEMC